MEAYLGLYIPIEKYITPCVTPIVDKCICICDVGMCFERNVLWEIAWQNVYSLGVPQVKKVEKKPEPKAIKKNHCEVDMEKLFTKARNERGKCDISEYMDSISRNGANLLEKQKNVEFGAKIPSK